jgi:RNA recognition motif-containing protein
MDHVLGKEETSPDPKAESTQADEPSNERNNPKDEKSRSTVFKQSTTSSPACDPGTQDNRRAISSTVFMTGMSPSLTKMHIEKLFGKFGTVHRVDIKTSKTGALFCFCELDSVENAQKAIDNLNGRMLLHKRLVVQPAHERTGGSHYSTVITQSSSSHTNPARERKMLDRKIEELKQKLSGSKR